MKVPFKVGLAFVVFGIVVGMILMAMLV